MKLRQTVLGIPGPFWETLDTTCCLKVAMMMVMMMAATRFLHYSQVVGDGGRARMKRAREAFGAEFSASWRLDFPAQSQTSNEGNLKVHIKMDDRHQSDFIVV